MFLRLLKCFFSEPMLVKVAWRYIKIHEPGSRPLGLQKQQQFEFLLVKIIILEQTF